MSLSQVRGTHVAAVFGTIGLLAVLAFVAPWKAETRSGAVSQVSNVAVNCEPGQQAMVRQIATGAEPQVSVQCVTTGMAGAQQVAYDQFGRPIETGLMAAPGYVPALYTQPVLEAPQPIVARTTPVRRTSTAARQVDSRRSWKKTALVIGGSAGAGAGIGAIVGGKKGALIGAAIGGGGAGIYEAIKRR